MNDTHAHEDSRSPLLEEVEAVLRSNPDATDAEICEAVNRWWQRVRTDESSLTVEDVKQIRASQGIPPTDRKPHQKRLF